MKNYSDDTRRCPVCQHLSTLATDDEIERYFYCQNPECSVERIYTDDIVMMSTFAAFPMEH